MADITENDRSLIIDINMDVITIGTQTDVEIQFIPGGTLQDRIVCR